MPNIFEFSTMKRACDTIVDGPQAKEKRAAARTDEIMAALNDEREGRKSNAVISLPDGEVWAHTCVLTKMLDGTIDRSWLKDSGVPGVHKVVLGAAFPRSIVQHVVDYFYTGAIDGSAPLPVLLRVLCAAHYIGASMVEDLSARIESVMLTPADAVAVHDVASRLHLALADSAMRVIGRNLESLSNTSFKVVASNLGHVLCEQAVFEAAVRYTEATGDFSVLLHVNFDALPASCRASISKLAACNLPAPVFRHMLGAGTPNAPKRTYTVSDCVVAVTAHGGAWLFDMRTAARYELPPLFPPEPLFAEPISPTFGLAATYRAGNYDKGLSAILVDGHVCVFFLERANERAVHVLKDGRWVFAGTTRYALSDSAAAVFGTFVTLLGGCCASSDSSSCERLVPGSTWIPRVGLPCSRRGCRAVAVEGELYVSGGRNAHGALSDILKFDGATATFVLAGNMLRARFGHAVAVLGTEIYLCGGESGSESPVFEVFDTRTGQSRALRPPPCGIRYSYHSAFVRGSHVFAIGGHYVDCYSIADDTWDTFSRSFPGGVAAVYVP